MFCSACWSELSSGVALCLLTLLCLGRHRGQPSVGWVDEKGRLPAHVPRPLQPVRWRGDGAADRPEGLELFGILEIEVDVVGLHKPIAGRHALPVLIVIQDAARADGLGALKWNTLKIVAVPDAL